MKEATPRRCNRTTIYLPDAVMEAARSRAKGRMRTFSNDIATLIADDTEKNADSGCKTPTTKLAK